MFKEVTGGAWWGYVVGAIIVSGLLLIALSLTPPRARKPLIGIVTFLAGLYYAAEWFLPVDKNGDNFLSPSLGPFSDMTVVLQACALLLGVYSLVSIHLRRVSRRREDWGYSVVLLVAMVVMAVVGILKAAHPNAYNLGLFKIIYDGAFDSMNATMFSLVAFYIVSAAYRAFRVRSLEATLLLASACLMMIGQVVLGQALTNWIPNTGFTANFRVENIANWILTRVNTPAMMGIDFGLGIGALATALRFWLSLERGSYFDEEL
jgi:hypothetical protein